MILKSENRMTRKIFSSAALSTINPSLTGLNQTQASAVRGLRHEAPQPCANVRAACLTVSYVVSRQYKQVYYYLGRSLRCRFGDVTLCALSTQANMRPAATFVFHDVYSDLICYISRGMKYLPKQHTYNLQPQCIPEKFLAPQLFCREFAYP